jgi:hypothetical protein
LLFRTRRELAVLQHEVAELTRTVERQGVLIAQLKKESARHERNDNLLCAYMQDEFARVELWLEALGGKLLPKVAAFANDLASRFGPGRTVPPHQLGGRTEARTE